MGAQCDPDVSCLCQACDIRPKASSPQKHQVEGGSGVLRAHGIYMQKSENKALRPHQEAWRGLSSALELLAVTKALDVVKHNVF